MPQSLSNVVTHLVFSTYHRDPTLVPEVRAELFPYCAGILRNHDCGVIEIGGVEDHIHLLFRLSRTLSISDTVKKLKGNSSAWVKERWPDRKGFAWQAGYGIFSVDRAGIEAEIKYIQTQAEHHRKRTFQDEFRELMALAGIEIDERYCWD